MYDPIGSGENRFISSIQLVGLRMSNVLTILYLLRLQTFYCWLVPQQLAVKRNGPGRRRIEMVMKTNGMKTIATIDLIGGNNVWKIYSK